MLLDYYTMAGAAELLGRQPSTITRAVRAGTLRGHPTACRKATLVRGSELRAWARTAAPGRPLVTNKARK